MSGLPWLSEDDGNDGSFCQARLAQANAGREIRLAAGTAGKVTVRCA